MASVARRLLRPIIPTEDSRTVFISQVGKWPTAISRRSPIRNSSNILGTAPVKHWDLFSFDTGASC